MAEGLLLRHHGDVILRGIADEFSDIGGRHRAAGRVDERRAGVLEGVLEVRRVDVELKSGEGADLALLKCERGDGTARKIVVEAAMWERGPVLDCRRLDCGGLDGGGLKRSVLAVVPGSAINNELLDGLRAVKEAGGGRGYDGKSMSPRQDDVTLVVHGGIEGEVCGGKQSAARNGVGAQQIDDGTTGTA